MNRVLDVDPRSRVAWVEPGVLNLDLTRAVSHLGLHYAPDPSSQQACTIGGNVATNAGGPHCLASGVTSAHVLAVDAVLADGEISRLGGLAPDAPGYDLRGCFVGSEAPWALRRALPYGLTPNPPAVATMLCAFRLDRRRVVDGDRHDRGRRVAGRARDDGRTHHARSRRLRGCRISARRRGGAARRGSTGSTVAWPHRSRRFARSRAGKGAVSVRVAADDAERALLWKGRKSAFGAIARIAPDYYLHDAVVPRTRLVEVLRRVYEIADAHRLITMKRLSRRRRQPAPAHRLRPAGAGRMGTRCTRRANEILTTCIDAGRVLTGEHGVGIEKRDLMPLMFSADDLDAQARLRDAFDPDGAANPLKILPSGSRCGELQRVPEGTWI